MSLVMFVSFEVSIDLFVYLLKWLNPARIKSQSDNTSKEEAKVAKKIWFTLNRHKTRWLLTILKIFIDERPIYGRSKPEGDDTQFFAGTRRKRKKSMGESPCGVSFESGTVTLIKQDLCQFEHFSHVTLNWELIHLQAITASKTKRYDQSPIHPCW